MKVKGDLRFGASATDGEIKRLYPEQEAALIDLVSNPLEVGRLWYVNGENRFAYDDGTDIQVIPNMNDIGGGGGSGGSYTFDRLVQKDILSEDNFFYIDIPATVINTSPDVGFGVGAYNTLDSLSFKLTAVIDMTDGFGGGGPSSSLTVDYVDGKARMMTNFTYGDDGAAITLPFEPVDLPTSKRVLILNNVVYEEVSDEEGGFTRVLRLYFLVKTPSGWTVPDECTLKGTMQFTSYGYDAS